MVRRRLSEMTGKKGHTAFGDRKGGEATVRGRKEQVQRAVTGKGEAE